MATPVLGLVGGVGSGKSFVAGLFAELGAEVIDADRLGHQALQVPALREQLLGLWGPSILGETGEVDRGKVAQIVFQNPQERRKLEQVVFPWIHGEILKRIEKAKADPKIPAVILDAAVLLESGWQGQLDAIVFVDVPDEIRKARSESRGWPPGEWERREAAQLPLVEKRRRSSHVIPNLGDVGQTRAEVRRLWRELVQAAIPASNPDSGS